MNSVQKAKFLIENNQNMTIATSDKSGKPWVSPVGFNYDDSFNLYWVSNKDALHSQNVRNRKEIAIVIFGPLPDGEIDGVYFDAIAVELNDKVEVQLAIPIVTKRPELPRFETKSLADVTGKSAWRIYKATPIAIYKRSDATLSGQAITVREPIELL